MDRPDSESRRGHTVSERPATRLAALNTRGEPRSMAAESRGMAAEPRTMAAESRRTTVESPGAVVKAKGDAGEPGDIGVERPGTA